jgi:Ca-activated chloride channel family protein
VSTEIEIAWEGQLTKGDIITLVPKGDERAFDNGNYRALKEGENTRLTTPKEPGEYEIRYVMAGGYTTYEGMLHSVQTSVPITVTDVAAAVSGPPSAVGGSTIEVNWRGPAEGWDNDFLSVVEPGAAKFNRHSMAKLAARGRAEAVNPVPIRVPAIAGDYELVYVMDPGQRIIARTPIAIVQAKASVDAPDTVKAGSSFTVKYSGDGFPGDRVVIAPVDAPDSKMWGYTVRYGFPAKPGESEGTVTAYPIKAGPGVYEARYVTGLQHQVIARDRFTVVE